jgi:hypothetical protein
MRAGNAPPASVAIPTQRPERSTTMARSPQDKMRDPRNQPDGSHDQDRHGRKQNTGSPANRAEGHDARTAAGGAAHGGGSGRDRSGNPGR